MTFSTQLFVDTIAWAETQLKPINSSCNCTRPFYQHNRNLFQDFNKQMYHILATIRLGNIRDMSVQCTLDKAHAKNHGYSPRNTINIFKTQLRHESTHSYCIWTYDLLHLVNVIEKRNIKALLYSVHY